MPLYEFECERCRTRIEVIQRFDDPPPAACPNCGGPLRRLLSAPAVHFKGSGFYITDYAKKGSTSASGAASEAKSAGGGESGTTGAGGASAASSSSDGGAAASGPSSAASDKPAGATKDSKKP
jgi:putative FmdB family regulatory protein